MPGVFPLRAFSTKYALKDLRYALDLAREAGVEARGATLLADIFNEAIERGLAMRTFR